MRGGAFGPMGWTASPAFGGLTESLGLQLHFRAEQGALHQRDSPGKYSGIKRAWRLPRMPVSASWLKAAAMRLASCLG
jgi:hypothetical protein